jgi:predicted NodU family carbamoyl transferase
MSILGLIAYHGDSAACPFIVGKLGAAAEAERFRGIKRWMGLPTQAIDYCLREAGLTINALDHIAVNRNSSLANATRAMNASSRRSLVGFELAAPCYRPGFLSGVDKAAARTGALWGRHSYMARVGHRAGDKIAARCFSRSVSSNLIMLKSCGVVGSTAAYDFNYGTGINL